MLKIYNDTACGKLLLFCCVSKDIRASLDKSAVKKLRYRTTKLFWTPAPRLVLRKMSPHGDGWPSKGYSVQRTVKPNHLSSLCCLYFHYFKLPNKIPNYKIFRTHWLAEICQFSDTCNILLPTQQATWIRELVIISPGYPGSPQLLLNLSLNVFLIQNLKSKYD